MGHTPQGRAWSKLAPSARYPLTSISPQRPHQLIRRNQSNTGIYKRTTLICAPVHPSEDGLPSFLWSSHSHTKTTILQVCLYLIYTAVLQGLVWVGDWLTFYQVAQQTILKTL